MHSLRVQCREQGMAQAVPDWSKPSFPTYSMHKHYLEHLLNTLWLGSIPRESGSRDLKWSPRLCNFLKHPQRNMWPPDLEWRKANWLRAFACMLPGKCPEHTLPCAAAPALNQVSEYKWASLWGVSILIGTSNFQSPSMFKIFLHFLKFIHLKRWKSKWTKQVAKLCVCI